MKQKLLIIDKCQFGYLTDSYKWCEYLRDEYDITMLCIDSGHKKLEMDGVKIEYVNFKMPFIFRAILFTIVTLWKVFFFKGKIFVVYYPTCSNLKRVFRNKKMHVDVRTMSVSPVESDRISTNDRIRRDCSAFDSVSAISQGVADELGFPNISIVPLGSDVISDTKKDYCGDLRLLYVGTFRNRNLEQTLYGMQQFVELHSDVNIHYDIVGIGEPGQLDKLSHLASELSIERYVTFHGFKPYDELKPFFDECNVGVCYVPIVECYQNQPPTKTYEYILSGLFCLATDTKANRELITSDNGVLIQDTPEAFCEGIEKYLTIRKNLDEIKIRKSLEFGLWKTIVNENLKPIIEKI